MLNRRSFETEWQRGALRTTRQALEPWQEEVREQLALLRSAAVEGQKKGALLEELRESGERGGKTMQSKPI